VRQLERRAGQKEERYAQLLGGTEEVSEPDGLGRPVHVHAATDGGAYGLTEAPTPQVLTVGGEGERSEDLAERLSRLEQEVAELRDGLGRLRRDLGGA
jgi:uncharacterized protein YceH (UPF0502 family)